MLRRSRPFLLAFLVVAIVLPLLGALAGTLLTSLRSPPRQIDDVAGGIVIASAATIEDSLTACAFYRTADGRIGILAPALVLRREDADWVRADYARDTVSRCEPIAKEHGLQVTARTLSGQIERWDWGTSERRKLRRGVRFRA